MFPASCPAIPGQDQCQECAEKESEEADAEAARATRDDFGEQSRRING